MASPQQERSLGELFSELANETTRLVRDEVQLAKIELGQKASEVGKRVGLIAVGGAVAYAGLLAAVAALILLIARFMPPWLAALVVGVVVLGIGYYLIQQQLNALKNADLTPRATVETLKQDKEWVREQTR
jgi:xanthine/uracil permease